MTHRIYQSAAWKYVRAQVLAESAAQSPTGRPVCSVCGGEANAVDHILPISEAPGLAYDLTNLRAICRRCNSSRNAKRQHQLARMARDRLTGTEPKNNRRAWGRTLDPADYPPQRDF